MRVDPENSEHYFVFESETYWFCCRGCLDKFQKDPQKYLNPDFNEADSYESAPPGTKFTCPMHPEIVQEGPGECPSCGMALQPMDPLLAADEPNYELIDFTRRFRVGLVFGLPVLILAMAPHLEFQFTSSWKSELQIGYNCYLRLQYFCGAVGRSFSVAGRLSGTAH